MPGQCSAVSTLGTGLLSRCSSAVRIYTTLPISVCVFVLFFQLGYSRLSLFLFLTHATSKLHMEKEKKNKFSENPSFSPDLNLFPFPLPTINLKICPALPLLQISYFHRKCRAMVYLEAGFRRGSRFFFYCTLPFYSTF